MHHLISTFNCSRSLWTSSTISTGNNPSSDVIPPCGAIQCWAVSEYRNFSLVPSNCGTPVGPMNTIMSAVLISVAWFVISITVNLSWSFRFWINDLNLFREIQSNIENASSKINILAFIANTPASASFCLSPPDRVYVSLFSYPSSPTAATTSSSRPSSFFWWMMVY